MRNAGPCDPSLPLSDERACDDAMDLPLAQVHSAVRALSVERYAGKWIDRSETPSRLIVAMVDLDDNDRATIERAAGDQATRVVAVGARYSDIALRRVQDALGRTMQEAAMLFSVWVDPIANRVVVGVPEEQRPVVTSMLAALEISPEIVSFGDYEQVLPAIIPGRGRPT